MLKVFLSKYQNSGLQHLAALIGYKSPEQPSFLKNVASIPKPFAFLQHLYYSLKVALAFQFYKTNNVQKLDKVITVDKSKEHLECFTKFKESGSSTDEVFTKNCEMLDFFNYNICPLQGSTHKEFYLTNAAVKDFLPISFDSNCTYYTTMIELIFHQATMQPRYLNIMEKGTSSFS